MTIAPLFVLGRHTVAIGCRHFQRYSSLYTVYRKKSKKDLKMRQFIKMLFGLPFLPPREMVEEFAELREDFEKRGESMISLYKYVFDNWLDHSVWKPRNICAFRRVVRTNNDAEGYHRRLNIRLGEKPPIYRLIQFLYRESILVDITCTLITCKTINMQRRKQTREGNAHILDLWSKFEDGLINAKELLLESTRFTAF